MNSFAFWLTIGVISLATFCLRYSFFRGQNHEALPAWLRGLLPWIPVVALCCIAGPGLVSSAKHAFDWARILSAIVAALVMLRSQSIAWTLVSGMLTLWLLRYLLFFAF